MEGQKDVRSDRYDDEVERGRQKTSVLVYEYEYDEPNPPANSTVCAAEAQLARHHGASSYDHKAIKWPLSIPSERS